MARRLANLGILAGVLAVVVLLVASGDGEGGGGTGAPTEWIVGLLLVLGPPLGASITRSVASSRLLRPVGGVASFLSLLASTVHLGVMADEKGGAVGVALALPALAATALTIAAVVAGPVPRDRKERDDPVTTKQHEPERRVSGPPLDVATPLLAARRQAALAVCAWLLVLVVVAVLSPVVLRIFGWPEIETELDTRVVSVERVAGRAHVTFEARHRAGTLRWSHIAGEDHGWATGERRTMFLDERDRVHLDQQFGLAGMPLIFPIGMTGFFVLLATRRLWGLVVAVYDIRNGSDQPVLGYAAVIDDPARGAVRPLLAVWRSDPTGSRLARPDAVYRADYETCSHLESAPSEVKVRRAWIDTGMHDRAKPRWVGVEDGIAVPHRRSVLGRRYVHWLTRRAEADDVADLEHGPPEAGTAVVSGDGKGSHKLGRMVAWRAVVGAIAIAIAFTVNEPGWPARPIG